MKAHPIPMKSGDEYDVFTRWRKLYCYTGRAGVCKAQKRKYNKRLRRWFKKEIKLGHVA